MGDFLTDLGLEINTQGLEDLIVGLFQWIIKFDVRDINVDYLSQLLTMVAPVWNPIWAAVNEFLGKYFGF